MNNYWNLYVNKYQNLFKMEFFKIMETKTTAAQIQKDINFDHLDDLCESIFIMNYNNNIAQIGGIWGDFSLQ